LVCQPMSEEEKRGEDLERGREVLRKYLQRAKLPDVIRDPPPEAPLSPRRWGVLRILRAVLRDYADEESKSFSFKLSTCGYVVIEVYLRRGGTVRVGWISDRGIYVGVGTREDVKVWLSSPVCMAADLTFMQSFKQSGYGCSGAVEYEAPYTGIHYVAVFGSWRPRIPGIQRSAEEFEVDLTLAPPKAFLYLHTHGRFPTSSEECTASKRRSAAAKLRE